MKSKRVPSVDALVRDLHLEHEYGDQARRVARTARAAMKTMSPHNAMITMNALFKMHGVETVAQRPNDWPMGEHFEYLNTGDTYAATIILYKGNYRISTMGDMVETMERRGVKFQ